MKTTTLTKDDAKQLAVGTYVWCVVHGAEGWYRVSGYRQRDGYLSLDGVKPFCPYFNFSLTDASGKTYAFRPTEELS